MMNEYHLFQWIAFGANGQDFQIVVKHVTEEVRPELDKKLKKKRMVGHVMDQEWIKHHATVCNVLVSFPILTMF